MNNVMLDLDLIMAFFVVCFVAVRQQCTTVLHSFEQIFHFNFLNNHVNSLSKTNPHKTLVSHGNTKQRALQRKYKVIIGK